VLKKFEQFPANRIFKDFLDTKIKELDFGPHHKKASEQVNELKNLINDFNGLKENSDEYISAHFSKQRNTIDQGRENLIREINQISNRLISEIDLQEQECKASLPKLLNLSTFGDVLTTVKADLNKYEQHLKYLVVNDDLWKIIGTNCSGYMKALNNGRLVIEEKTFGNYKKLKSEKDISDTFIKQLTKYKMIYIKVFIFNLVILTPILCK
jgi:hypothetical protein